MINIQGNYLVIEGDSSYDYDIQLKQLDTHQKLENWIYHMEEKTWWCKLKTEKMISLCNQYFGYNFKYEN